jgi:hypothetical protein
MDDGARHAEDTGCVADGQVSRRRRSVVATSVAGRPRRFPEARTLAPSTPHFLLMRPANRDLPHDQFGRENHAIRAGVILASNDLTAIVDVGGNDPGGGWIRRR